MSRVISFLAELKRRRVYHVAVVYGAAAFVVAQAADLFLPRLGLPDWTVTLVVVVATAGLPVALILAWAFDITPSGMRRTAPASEEAPAARPGRRRAAAGSAAAAVVLVAGGWWLSNVALGPFPSAMDRLAVLPLASLMNDPDQDYFVQGMHDALISELAQAGVPVIARTSVIQYASSSKSIREIARELNVAAVIEGSVLREGERIRIQIQLINGRTQDHLWARTYDAELREVLALHRRVTRDVAREIQARLTPRARTRLLAAQPVHPEAYEAYLRGRFHTYQKTRVNLDAAMEYFQAALRQDPGYALPHAGISAVWWLRGNMLYIPFEEAHAQAKAAALRALELDDRLAQGHDILGRILVWYEWDWATAEKEYRRAIALNPSSADARTYYSLLLMTQGRIQEANSEIEKAIELDPLNPFYQTVSAYQQGQARRYDDAIAQARKAMAMADADSFFLREIRWRALHQKGAYQEALAEARALFADDAEILNALSRGYAEGGYAGANRWAAETLAARGPSSFWEREHVAILYAFAAQRDRAIDWLEQGYDTHHSMMSFIGIDPHWDVLRSEPRFHELLRKLDLPQAGAGLRPVSGSGMPAA